MHVEPRGRNARLARELAALACLLVSVGLVMGRGPGRLSQDFDEGVYLASARALAEGATLGRDVFASQPPLFFELVTALHRLANGDDRWIRIAMVVIPLIGAAAGWAVVRPMAGPHGGLVAAAAMLVAPTIPLSTGVVSATLPSQVLAVAAVAAALRWRRHLLWAAAAGALFAMAVLVKLLALPAGAALVALAMRDRPPGRVLGAAAAGATAVAAFALLAGGADQAAVWHGVVAIRGEARRVHLPPSAPDLATAAAVVGLALLGGLAAVNAVRGRSDWIRRRAPLAAWTVAATATVALHRPLFIHHLAALSVPAALLAASAVPRRPGRGTRCVLCLVAVLGVPGLVAARPTVGEPERARLDLVALILRGATGPRERVVSDLPLVPLLADRRPVAATIDASYVRVGAGALDRASIVAATRSAGAVVSGRAFRGIPGLDGDIRRRFPVVVRVGGTLIYLRGIPPGPRR